MYLSRGKRDADAQQLERLQKQLAKVTLEMNAAKGELAVIKRARKTARQDALEDAAARLRGLGSYHQYGLTADWLEDLAKE